MIRQAKPLGSFRQAYADAIIPYEDTPAFHAAQREAMKHRDLKWHGERIPLAQAASIFAELVDGYNAFRPDTLKDLLAAFPNDGIEVTPAREYSVAVYLHIPASEGFSLREQVEAFIREKLEADEIDWYDGICRLEPGEPGAKVCDRTLADAALRVWWD
jgi:hypothetical protein